MSGDAAAERELLIEYDEKSMVMTVSINRPARGNSLSGELVRQLLEVVRDVTATFEQRVLNISKNAKSASAAPLVRVFVLTAVGKIFCSGMDLKSAASDKKGHSIGTETTIALFDSIRSMPMPTVLLLNGPALGGGTVFAFLVDFVIAVRGAYVQFSEVKIGLLPAMISCFIVPRIGTAQAGAMMLSGRRYQIDELHRSMAGGIALVSSDAADVDELRAAGVRFVHEHLLTSSSFASSHMKRLIAYVSTHSHADNCGEAQRAFATVFAGEDMRYGLECFGKKEKPNWTNRLKARL
jgi:methylglutaconyl-CoA hydratase